MDIEKNILLKLEDVDYVSFDIYDTILFRNTRIPYQIFDKTYEMVSFLFPDYIDACEWREIRIYAEKYAKEKKGKSEVTLEDIYREMPKIIEHCEQIMEAEIETELKNTFLNPEMVEILYNIKEKYRKKILLTSDMYLSKENIQKILVAHGFNISFVECIYVSSEVGVRKSDGGMYALMCQELKCRPEKIMHIGDNWEADYVRAKKAGIQSIYYSLISEARNRYPYLDYEKEYYGEIGKEIYAMRLLAADNKLKGEEKEWFEIGAMVLGPLLTCAAEWVLDVAEKTNIYNIYPMMREGYFLTKILKNAAKERNWQGVIKPLYISRKALYPALLSVLKQKDVEYLLNTRRMTVGGIIDLFEVEDDLPELFEYKDKLLCDATEIMVNEKSIYQILNEYFTSNSKVEKIKEQKQDVDEIIWKYFEGMKMDKEAFITLDVGWRGNAQNAIERIRKKRRASSKSVHLLVTGKKEILKERNLEDSTDIRGFTGNFGKNFRQISDIMIPIFEMFFMCAEGTTIGYKINNQSVIPICKKIEYKEEQLKMMEIVQEGILSFQEVFYTISKCEKTKIRVDADEVLKIATRLTAMPTKREAELIGKMQYDQNFGVDSTWTIINSSSFELYKELGYNKFVSQKLAREDEWYQGMDVCIDSLFNYKRIMFHRRNSIAYQYAMYAERICEEFDTFVLVGAGKRIKQLLFFLKLMNEMDKVEFAIDNNNLLQGENILGINIHSMEKKSKSNCYVITTNQRKIINELTVQLQELNGIDIKILTIYKGGI